ncbi:glycosyltransferase family 4 protein [Vreelandella arctica]|uniref:glycosyltransferase family 4 protein n=1 Tax=Vreelandella arctica TaxID=3126499 RepID=UPI00300E2066
MHIIVNLQPLLTPLTGIGHYTRELTRELLQHDSLSLEGVTGRKLETLTLEHPLLQTTNVAGQPRTERDHLAWQLARRYLRNGLTRKMYRWLCSQRLQYNIKHPDALYWEPNYVLLPWQGRSVVTVHDLSHKRYPEHHPAERVRFLDRHLPESLQRATRINVVSQFTADELQELHGVSPERIDIVPPAVAERFFQPPSDAITADLRQHYQLPPRYLLSVGTLEPRKNLATVLEAFASLPFAQQQATPLLLAGMQGWGSQVYSEQVQQAFTRGTIRRLGYVPTDDLPGLYALAQGFVYVSLYEGFGMPVVEAMAAGAPVLTANTTATTEVAAGAALEVDPLDKDAIRHGLQRLMEETHDSYIAAGKVRAQQFTWQRSAEQLLASFHRAASEPANK